MATGGNQRNVDLAIGISTSGTEAVAGLRKAVTDLGQSGATAAPELERLVAELDRVAQQQNALGTFATLRRDVSELGAALDKAAADVDRYGQQLPAVREQTANFSAAQREAGEAVASIKANIDSTKAELAALGQEYPKGKRNVDEYRNAASALREELARLKTGLAEAKQEQNETVIGARAAAAAEKELATSYSQAVKAAAELSGEFAKQNRALDEARAAVDAAGLSAKNLAFSQEIVRIGFNETNGAIEKNAAAVKTAIETTNALAKAQGFLDTELDLATAAQRKAAAAEEQRVQAVQKLTTAIQQQGRAAATALEQAFSNTGVRSAQAIDAELRKIDDSLLKIARDANQADFDRAFAGSRARVEALKAELAGVPASIDKATKSSSLLGDAMRQASIYFSAFTVGKEFIDANAQLEGLQRSLTIVTGSAETAAQQIAFLRKTADESGVAIGSITGAYTKFAASAVAAGIDLQTVNRTFADVTKAAASLGLSSDEVGGALTALGQIASKGKVSMEELGQQLGDRLPAVLATTAKGLGVTTAELTKLIEQGQLLGDANFFNAFSKGIEETFIKGEGRVEGLNASIGRLKTSFSNLFTGEEGRGSAVAVVIDALTNRVNAFSQAMSGVGAGLGGFFASIFRIRDAFDSSVGPVTALKAAYSTLQESYVEFIQKAPALASLLGQGQAVAAVAALEQKKLAESTKATADAAAAAGLSVEAYTAKVKAAGDATTASGVSNVKIIADYTQLISLTEAAGNEAERLAKAKKIETDQTILLAAASGDEERARVVAVSSAVQYAVALENVATIKAREAGLIQGEIDALKANTDARTANSASFQAQIAGLEKKQVASAAEAEQAKQAAEAAKNEVEQRRIAALTYQDNSSRLAELTKAMEASNVAVKTANAELAAGKITREEFNEVTRKAAEAQALFRDALQDTVDKLKALAEVQKADVDIATAKLNVQKAAIQAEIDVAKARGDEFTAIQKTVELKQIEIKIIEAKSAAQKAEAEASIAVAKATLAELEAAGKLTDIKRLQIDATIKSAEAKKLEADALLQGTKVLQQQINNLQTYGSETVKTAGSSEKLRTSTDALSTSLRGAGSAAGEGAKGLQTFTAAAAAAGTAAGSLSSSLDARNRSNMSILSGNQYDRQGFAVNPDGSRVQGNQQAVIPEGGTFDQAAFQREVNANARAGRIVELDPQRFVRGPDGKAPTGEELRQLRADRAAAAAGTGTGTTPTGAVPSGVSYREELGSDGLIHVFDSNGKEIGVKPGPKKPGDPAAAGGAGLQPVTINIGGVATRIDVGAGQAGALAEVLKQLAAASQTAS